MIEYALLIALIGLVSISLLSAIGNSSSKSLDTARHALDGKPAVSSGSSQSTSSSSINVHIAPGVSTNNFSGTVTHHPSTKNQTVTTDKVTETTHKIPGQP